MVKLTDMLDPGRGNLATVPRQCGAVMSVRLTSRCLPLLLICAQQADGAGYFLEEIPSNNIPASPCFLAEPELLSWWRSQYPTVNDAGDTIDIVDYSAIPGGVTGHYSSNGKDAYEFTGYWSTGCKEDLVEERNLGVPSMCVLDGNPVNSLFGNKLQIENDFVGKGPAALTYVRYYNSSPRVQAGSLGRKWRSTYDRELSVEGSMVKLFKADGGVVTFVLDGLIWKPLSGEGERLRTLVDGWEVRYRGGARDEFDELGKLRKVVNPGGNAWSISRDPEIGITRVENDFGDHIVFTHERHEYATAIIGSEPTAYWRLGELAGSTAYDSASGHSGVYAGSYELGRDGLLSARLDASVGLGGNGYVDVGTVPLLNLNTFTIEAWIVLDSLGATRRIYANYRTPETNPYNGVVLEVTAAGKVRVWCNNGAFNNDGSEDIESAQTLSTVKTHHIVVTRDGRTGQAEIFIDGRLDSRQSLPETPSYAGAQINLGGSGNVGSFAGRLDEVAVYSRTLSKEEIEVHYQFGVSRNPYLVTAVTNRAGQVWRYEYDAFGILIEVTNPDGTYRAYDYGGVRAAGRLTGVTDERGIQISNYEYQGNGSAVRTSQINNVGRREITYNEDGTRIVTDSLGRVKTYNTTKSLGEILPAQITR